MVATCSFPLEVGAQYMLSLTEEVRHVLGIPDRRILVQCVMSKTSPLCAGVLVPCIWGQHFFVPEVLGPEAVWEKVF